MRSITTSLPAISTADLERDGSSVMPSLSIAPLADVAPVGQLSKKLADDRLAVVHHPLDRGPDRLEP